MDGLIGQDSLNELDGLIGLDGLDGLIGLDGLNELDGLIGLDGLDGLDELGERKRAFSIPEANSSPTKLDGEFAEF